MRSPLRLACRFVTTFILTVTTAAAGSSALAASDVATSGAGPHRGPAPEAAGKRASGLRSYGQRSIGARPSGARSYGARPSGARGPARSRPLPDAVTPVSTTPPRADTSLTLSASRATLVEGGGSLRVTVRVPRVPSGREVMFSVSGVDGDELDGIEHRFEPATLVGGQEETKLRLKLPVEMGPRLPHVRAFRVRAESDGRDSEARLEIDVEPTGAPNVYLLIGQSNMVGISDHGSKQAEPGEIDAPDPRIRQLHVTRNSPQAFPEPDDLTRESANWRDVSFIVAEDPLHDDRSSGYEEKGGDFIGLGLSFAKSALERTTRKVYLVPAAWGGTGFCANANGDLAWNATPYSAPGLGGTLLLERALLRLDKTLRETGGVLRGILWHQGGADSNDPRCADSYADNLRQMVRRFRREAGRDPRGTSARGDEAAIPFIVATQSKGSDERGDYGAFGASKRTVDAVHRNVAELIRYADHVNNDDLVPPAYPCGRSSCVHFGAEALREQGRRFDRALRRILAR